MYTRCTIPLLIVFVPSTNVITQDPILHKTQRFVFAAIDIGVYSLITTHIELVQLCSLQCLAFSATMLGIQCNNMYPLFLIPMLLATSQQNTVHIFTPPLPPSAPPPTPPHCCSATYALHHEAVGGGPLPERRGPLRAATGAPLETTRGVPLAAQQRDPVGVGGRGLCMRYRGAGTQG